MLGAEFFDRIVERLVQSSREPCLVDEAQARPGLYFYQLREIQAHVEYAETVYARWGFEKRILAGRGLNVLFSGPSGTGKTMAASILAGRMRKELYKIDLSTVVSKYIGETEKNLARGGGRPEPTAPCGSISPPEY